MIEPTRDQREILMSSAKYRVVVKPRRWGASTLCWMAADPSLSTIWIASNLHMVEHYRLLNSTCVTSGQTRMNGEPLLDWIDHHYWDLCLYDELPMVDTDWFIQIHNHLCARSERFIFTGTPRHYDEGEPDWLREFYNMAQKDGVLWQGWHFKSSPFVGPDVIEKIRPTLSEDIFRSEILGEFIDS